jgi:hypothetical protein
MGRLQSQRQNAHFSGHSLQDFSPSITRSHLPSRPMGPLAVTRKRKDLPYAYATAVSSVAVLLPRPVRRDRSRYRRPVSVFSRSATAMRLLLYNSVNDREPAEIIDFDRDTDRWGDVWSLFVPGIGPGQLVSLPGQRPLGSRAGAPLRFGRAVDRSLLPTRWPALSRSPMTA